MNKQSNGRSRSMKTKRCVTKSLTLAALIMVMCLPLNVLAEDKKVYELTMAWNDIWGPKFRASQVYRPCGEMERMVHEATNGRVKLKITSRMFPSDEILRAVATGKADIGDVPMPWLSGNYPLLNWGLIPNIVDQNPVKALGEELAVYEDPEVKDIMDQRLKDVGLKLWFVTQWDPANGIWSKKKINSLDDLKGMKLSVAGGFLANLGVKSMGGSPVAITNSELAPAMVAGTVDGVLTSMGYGYSIGLADVSNHFTLTPLNPTWTAWTVINRDTYNSMPPHLQKKLMEVGKELQRMVKLSTTAEYIMSLDAIEMEGVERSTLPSKEQEKALEKCQVVKEKWLEETGDKGKELYEIIKDVVSEYRDPKFCQ